MTIRRGNIVCLLGLLILGAGLACKKTVKVDLNNAPSRIVIEGEITNQPGPYQVKITRTVAFDEPNDFPPVPGAIVWVTDSNNSIMYQFVETTPGIYTANFTGVPRHRYYLDIQVDTLHYTANSTMPDIVHLDSVTFALNTDLDGKKELNAVVNFKDPGGVVNYYQFIERVNGRIIPNTFVFEDRLSDGRYIEQPLYNDSSYLHKGDTLLLKMHCIDKNIYNYFFSLMQVSGNDGFQTASPDNPITNISGGALGYFSAHTISSEKMVVY